MNHPARGALGYLQLPTTDLDGVDRVLRGGARLARRAGARQLRGARADRPVDHRAGAEPGRAGAVVRRRRPLPHPDARHRPRRHRPRRPGPRPGRALAGRDRGPVGQPARPGRPRAHRAVADHADGARRRGQQPVVPGAARPHQRPRWARLRAAARGRRAGPAAPPRGHRPPPRPDRRRRAGARQRRTRLVRRGERLRRRGRACRAARGRRREGTAPQPARGRGQRPRPSRDLGQGPRRVRRRGGQSRW